MHTRRLAVLEIGTGCDLHGQDATRAATRACRAALEFNSLPVLARLCEGGDLSLMHLRIRLGVPAAFVSSVDVGAVKDVFPYGSKEVVVVEGGLEADSGIWLEEQGDGKDDCRAVVVVAAVEVHC